MELVGEICCFEVRVYGTKVCGLSDEVSESSGAVTNL